ncbi:hypothetical protein ACX80D_05425 [Arthrobacter sp. Sr24]
MDLSAALSPGAGFDGVDFTGADFAGTDLLDPALVDPTLDGTGLVEPAFADPDVEVPAFAELFVAVPSLAASALADSGGRNFALARGRGTRRRLLALSVTPDCLEASDDSEVCVGTGSIATFLLVPRTVPEAGGPLEAPEVSCSAAPFDASLFGVVPFGAASFVAALLAAVPSPSAGMRVRMTRGLRGSAIAVFDAGQ